MNYPVLVPKQKRSQIICTFLKLGFVFYLTSQLHSIDPSVGPVSKRNLYSYRSLFIQSSGEYNGIQAFCWNLNILTKRILLQKKLVECFTL